MHAATRRDTDVEAEDEPTRAQQLGQLIRKHRTERGWTQRELAERAGIGWQTVHRLEAGQPRSRQTTVWPKLEKGLNWPQGFIADFLSGDADEAALAGNLR